MGASFEVAPVNLPYFLKFWVLYMTRVPLYRGRAAELLRRGRQKAIIIGGVPIPADDGRMTGKSREGNSVVGIHVGDKVNSQSELVCTLPRSRFRNALGDHARLPVGAAICLEDFEAGLRATGLIAVDEVLIQAFDGSRKFRVEAVQVGKSDVHAHDWYPSGSLTLSEGRARLAGQAPPHSSVTARKASLRGSSQGRRAERALTGPETELLEHQRSRVRALQTAKRGSKTLLDK